jgi:DNA-binding winged helix-turn-helix (wHTH) protein
MNDIAVNLGLSPRSVRVLISVLRKHLRIIGLEDVINTEYRVGYSVNHQGVVRVVEKVASLKNVADTN